MALTPPHADVKPLYGALAGADAVGRYRDESEAMYAARTRPRCFARATVPRLYYSHHRHPTPRWAM